MAATDLPDVTALQDLYRTLGYPPQLKGWTSDGGDPCVESWTGISCNGTAVRLINLAGLDLGGTLGWQLNLPNLWQLDLSFNRIEGEIPGSLPLNITYIDLSSNKFSINIPYSLAFMKHLRYLNLSHNSLSGPVSNLFGALQILKEMDLSYNSFIGDLPSSFGNLTNLTALYLQNNNFTGSVTFLENLQLTDLNIQNNNFSGVLPKQFQRVPNLWIWGNEFQFGADSPPWDFPQNNIPTDQNINSPPTNELNAIESYPRFGDNRNRQKRFSPVGIACGVVGVALVATCAAILFAVQVKRARALSLKDPEGGNNSSPISTKIDLSFAPEELPQSSTCTSPPVLVVRRLPSVRHGTSDDLNGISSSSRRLRKPLTAKSYTIAELQSATNGFCSENLLGEGSLGSVFKAEFPNGQISAVKNISTVALSIHEEEQFLDVVMNIARLRHPNILKLVGYCMENGHHLLVYEYLSKFSLEDALHYNVLEHLNWILRIRIALSIARGLNYLHSTCFPPVAHGNLKAANILLDDELLPRLSDCGLAVLKPLTSNSTKLKTPELVVSCIGYTAPEKNQAGTDKIKSDIFAFGVLLLELLTGRKAFDSSRPRHEQYLVKWASSRLHDYDSLEAMVDPTAKGTYSSRSLSRFADIVSLCIQTEPEFRPPMPDILDSLELLIERSSSVSCEKDVIGLPFRTSTSSIHTPLSSYISV
ncbi:non-specific serine/threonine protein kinase [Ranunculus cassubicifolius]